MKPQHSPAVPDRPLLGFLRALIPAGFFALSLLFVAAPAIAAATYVVAPNGNDSNPGTVSQPFATLQKAVNLANPGDTIYLRAGIYAIATQTQITRSGSNGNPINIFNYPGEVPVLDGASNQLTGGYSLIRLDNVSWWHIKGLELRNGPGYGIYLVGTASNIIVEGNNVHHNVRLDRSGAGILVENGSNNLILNNDSHHNGVPGTTGGDGIGLGSQGTGNIIRGNRVWRNNDDGIDLWDAANVLVENNLSWENGYNDALVPSGGDGNGFKLGGGGAGDGNHTIQNNAAWRNFANGFDDNSANLPMNVFNNTAYENRGRNFSFYSPVVFVLKNNVSIPSTSVYIPSPSVQANNSWNVGVTAIATDFASLDYSGATGPRNADWSLPTLNFLKLVSGSNLIDKGVNIGLPYTGGAPDLGAYEFAGTPTPATVPVTAGNGSVTQPSCPATTLNVATAKSDTGAAYNLVRTFGIRPDSGASPAASTLRLFENGLELGSSHSAHANIRDLGAGRFSHWTDGATESLYFSASDNSDPRSNGKSYTYCTGAALADATAPTTPPGLSASAVSRSQINLSWPAATDNVGVTGYSVYRDGTKVAMVSGTSYQDSGLRRDTPYSYTVSAYDAAGNNSNQSGAVSVTTPRR